VYVRGRKFVLHLIPSGILHPGVTCVIGNGVVIDPQALFTEVDRLGELAIETAGRLLVSDRAHLILPYHRELDVLSEARRGERKIGTTSRGIGPAYEDKNARRGLRVCDLKHPDTVSAHLRESVKARNRVIPEPHLEWQDVRDQLLALGERLMPMIVDASAVLVQAMREGRHVMFEGAQGTMLDIDHGTYPYVTSSNGTAGGVCTGLGVPPRAVHGVLGVAKTYTTRVGEGPLPTELHDEIGDRLRESGQEYGASTGRPRRCGWYDAVAVRYAARINGLDALALTKLDVLDGMEQIAICTGYRHGDMVLTDFPADLQLLERCEPVYETVPGWSAPTRGIRRFDHLPEAARAYIRRLEEVSDIPAAIVSTGSDRDDTIIRDDSVVSSWFGGAIPASV
jgi:adenylosuccinate synthase